MHLRKIVKIQRKFHHVQSRDVVNTILHINHFKSNDLDGSQACVGLPAFDEYA